MIYFASDMHAENRRALEEYERIATEGDLLIILGDLGIGFQDTEENRAFDGYFLSLRANIAFIDGNHENHPLINSYPRERWCGGEVHRLSPNIVHLMRGNVYDIVGESFFVMGGCKSSPKWKEMGLWYEGEEPSEEEISLAYQRLRERGGSVDYVLTHKYEDGDLSSASPTSLDGLIHYLKTEVSYKAWISGHWHEYIEFDNKCLCVYDELIKKP